MVTLSSSWGMQYCAKLLRSGVWPTGLLETTESKSPSAAWMSAGMAMRLMARATAAMSVFIGHLLVAAASAGLCISGTGRRPALAGGTCHRPGRVVVNHLTDRPESCSLPQSPWLFGPGTPDNHWNMLDKKSPTTSGRELVRCLFARPILAAAASIFAWA